MKKIATALLTLCSLNILNAQTIDQTTTNTKEPVRHINARLFVPGLFIGFVGGAIDFKVSPAITLGPSGKYFAYGHTTGYSLGLEMNYALNGDVFSDGWMINPNAGYYQSNYESHKTDSSVLAGVNLMYQWIWQNGLNLQLGGGVAYSTVKLPLGIAGNNHLTPNIDFTVGYAF